ncbi:uncharacterized protein EV154DRAFT_487295 [Mucor mucedo]|uniref:uncharacterized protein n=1 Tax=Mucor mucedo TaxID=29922 RepID=UPI002220F7C7|nr:uncharacterized protein EV154DRAFT_487295 [Mucor mucedo]KAI7873315.1 hypothetical protein EV154DRAFT_487295 [Mucor mucedo]
MQEPTTVSFKSYPILNNARYIIYVYFYHNTAQNIACITLKYVAEYTKYLYRTLNAPSILKTVVPGYREGYAVYPVNITNTKLHFKNAPSNPATDSYPDLKFAETPASELPEPISYQNHNVTTFVFYFESFGPIRRIFEVKWFWGTLVHYPSISNTSENSGPLSFKIHYFWELWSVIRQDPILLVILVRYPSRSDSFCELWPIIRQDPIAFANSGPLSVKIR